MSQDKKRLDKIEESLTPKQAVILWMSGSPSVPGTLLSMYLTCEANLKPLPLSGDYPTRSRRVPDRL